jgi:hypothetical protein
MMKADMAGLGTQLSVGVPVNMRAKRCPGPVESPMRMRHGVAREVKRRRRRGNLRWREGPSRTWTRCATVSRLPRAMVIPYVASDQLPSDVLNSFGCKEVLYPGCWYLYRETKDHCLSYKPNLSTARHRCTTVPGIQSTVYSDHDPFIHPERRARV